MRPLAYVVLAHRLPHQLVRLIEALSSESASFFLHIDRGAPTTVFEEARTALKKRHDVTLLRRFRTPWGSLQIVRATLEGIDAARRSGAERVVVLTGQDYPIKPTRVIEDLFEANRGRSFIELHPMPRADWHVSSGGLERYDARGVSILGRQFAWRDRRRTAWMPRRRVELGAWQPHHGGMQFTLHADACDLVLDRLLDRRGLERTFGAVQIPDETAIHTVLANSPLAPTLVRDDLFYQDWSANGPHPEVLGVRHLPALESSSALFARKFDESTEPEVLDLVDERLR